VHSSPQVFTQVLTRAELGILLEWKPEMAEVCDPTEWRDSLLLHILITSGMRRAEASTLSFPGSVVRIAGAPWWRIHGKGEKIRTVPIGAELMTRLQNFWAVAVPKVYQAVEHPAVFCLHPGYPLRPLSPSRIYRIVRQRSFELLGFTSRPHVLRHSIATLWLQTGADIRTVQGLLGHSQMTSTQRYLHTTAELMAQACATATGVIQPAPLNLPFTKKTRYGGELR
jgi:site-specific recombinase XerD